MNSKRIIVAIGILLAFQIVIASAAHPNIIIMMADDLGYGDLGCFGHKHIQTPNLDRLALTGTRFTSFYSGHPTCSPSRAGMMSGRTPFRSGIYNYIPGESCVHLRDEEVTVAEICKAAGYSTGFFGKWGLIGDMEDRTQAFPNDQGFDHWFATHNNANPSHRNPDNFYKNGKPQGVLEGFSSQIVVNQAVEWLSESRDKSKPFFLVLWFHEPHLVLAQPDEFTQKYIDHGKKLADYYANVDRLDHQIGRFLAFLDEHEMRDNTWITFTSDNGPLKKAGGDSGGLRGGKAFFYEGGYREPTIMHWNEKLDGGKTIDQPLTFFDFVPTFYELLGVDKLNTLPLDGVSMLPAFNGQAVTRPLAPIWMGRHDVTVRQGAWKLKGRFQRVQPGVSLTEHLKTRKPVSWEMYNLQQDQRERNELSEVHSDVFRQTRDILLQRLESVQAEIKAWGGMNVVPERAARSLGGRFKEGAWKKMSAVQQEYLGHPPANDSRN